MRVTPLNYDNFSQHNSNYNERFLSAADDTVFASKTFGDIEYIPVGKKTSRKDTDVEILNPENSKQPFLLRTEFEDQYDVEELIINCLLYGHYSTYFMAGGMGSGKTSTAMYVIGQIRKRLKNTDSFIEALTFNFNSDGKEPTDVILKRFNSDFFDKLIGKLSEYLYNRPAIISTFIEAILEDTDKYSVYAEIITACRNDSWIKMTENMKREKILDHLHGRKKEDVTKAIRAIMLFLNFIFERTKGEDRIIMLVDNIDTIGIEAQIEVCLQIARYNEDKTIKCLIPVRRATLRRYENYENKIGKQAFHYNLIFFRSHDPVSIIRARLKHWIESSSTHPIINSMNTEQVDAFRKRLQYLYDNLQEGEHANYFSRAFSQLTGRSIRMAVALSMRTIVNSCCRYNHDFDNHFQATTSLFFPSRHTQMLTGDNFVANIFRSGLKEDDKFSLISLRILTYVVNFGGDSKMDKVGALMEYIKGFRDESGGDKWSAEEVTAAFAKLFNDYRPLLYTDYREGLRKLDNLTLDPDVRVFPTEIGSGYYKYLIKDYKYLMTAFLPLSFDDTGYTEQWKLGQFVDMKKTSERLFLLVRQLNHFFERDVASLKVNDSWINLSLQPKCISSEIICSVARNFLSVMRPTNSHRHLQLPRDEKRQFFELFIDLLKKIRQSPYAVKRDDHRNGLCGVEDVLNEVFNAKGTVY